MRAPDKTTAMSRMIAAQSFTCATYPPCEQSLISDHGTQCQPKAAKTENFNRVGANEGVSIQSGRMNDQEAPPNLNAIGRHSTLFRFRFEPPVARLFLTKIEEKYTALLFTKWLK
jgi:hypothetical protein